MVHTKENTPGVFLDFNFKEDVRAKFQKIQTVRQFAVLLNFIEKSNKPEDLRKKISARDLHFLAISKDRRYTGFFISKKNGDKRKINTPDDYLKRIQSVINTLLQIIFENHVHYNTNGFLISRDIVRNAIPHVNKKYLLNIDIENYFPSIQFRRIKTVLGLSPFNLKESREKIGFIIANICCYDGVLPQGAPTSPIISNIVTQKLDRRITKLCNKEKIKYSRYADDLSFSSNKDINNKYFIKRISTIIISENFKLNDSKTRLKTNRDRQQVTGIIVNQKLNVSRKYIQKTRAILNNWEKGGPEFAQEKFNLHYLIEDKGLPDFRKVLSGYISFIGLVRGREDTLYKKLILKYGFLKNQINYDFISNLDVKNRLVKDNINMEMLLFESLHSDRDRFILFCTRAFHQIENLINFHYWNRFPEMPKLLQFLKENNPILQKKWKKHTPNFKEIGMLNIELLVYAYEKEFYFDKKIPYHKDITLLREIRNDNSHRCEVVNYNIQQIRIDYGKIKELNKKYLEKHRKFRPLTTSEEKIKVKYKVIRLVEDENYKRVRKILKKIVSQIKDTKYSTHSTLPIS